MKKNNLLILLLSLLIISCSKGNFINSMGLERFLLTTHDFRGIKFFAHRGYWDTEGSYENTLTSISKAAEVGVHGVELDMRYSADTVIFIHHDGKLDDGRDFRDMTSEEIDRQVLPNGDKIPRLTEALALIERYPDLLVNLEIKLNIRPGYTDAFIKNINDAVMTLKKPERVFFSSFSNSILLKSKEYNPHIRTQFIAKTNFDIQESVDAKVDMINYKLYLLKEDASLISTANSYGIDVCTGAGTLASVIGVLNRDWNIKYINTDEPQLVMEIYDQH